MVLLTSFVLPAPALPVILGLIIKETLSLLAEGKSTIALLPKADSSL